MTVQKDGAERLAEIFREIFTLSETDGPNHSKSATADGSISEICAPNGKQASDEGSQTEHQEPLR